MKISVNNVKRLSEKLQTKLSNFNENRGLYYSALRYTSNDWFDANSRKYFETINEERNNEVVFLTEMRKLYYIYRYIAASYDDIGDDIYYNPDFKERILDSLELNKQIINNIISTYGSIGINYFDERSILYEQRRNFIDMRYKMSRIESKIKNSIRRIETTETATKQKLKEIEIKKITEKDIKPYL